MPTATFFGHRDFNYSPHKAKIEATVIELIENCGIRKFYNGFRGNFDGLCAEIVSDLKIRYSNLKNITVLSYHNQNFVFPNYFDESVYLLEKCVPPQYAISYTNQEMILRSDFIVSGVRFRYGGAYKACQFARRHKKIILEIFEDK